MHDLQIALAIDLFGRLDDSPWGGEINKERKKEINADKNTTRSSINARVGSIDLIDSYPVINFVELPRFSSPPARPLWLPSLLPLVGLHQQPVNGLPGHAPSLSVAGTPQSKPNQSLILAISTQFCKASHSVPHTHTHTKCMKQSPDHCIVIKGLRRPLSNRRLF